jgi:hypothetical protein
MGNQASREVPELPEPPVLLGTKEELDALKAQCAVHMPGTLTQSITHSLYTLEPNYG